MRAGLIPALKKEEVLGSKHWLYGTLKPERTPLENLARVVSDFRNSPEAGKDLLEDALSDPARGHCD